MLNSNIIFNILFISHPLHNDSKQFFLFIPQYFMRDIHREGDNKQQFCRPWYVFFIDVYGKQGLICSFPYWYLWKAEFGLQFPLLMYMERGIWFAVYLIDVYGKWGLVCSFPYWCIWKVGFGLQFPLLMYMESGVWVAVSLIDIYGMQVLVCSFPLILKLHIYFLFSCIYLGVSEEVWIPQKGWWSKTFGDPWPKMTSVNKCIRLWLHSEDWRIKRNAYMIYLSSVYDSRWKKNIIFILIFKADLCLQIVYIWYIWTNQIWQNLTDKMKCSFFQAAVVSILLYGCTTWTLTKRLEKKLDGNYTRMLRAILNRSW